MLSHIWLFATQPWTVAHQAPLFVGYFHGKNTAVGCHALLQGIFPTQGWNQHRLHFRQVLYHWATWEAPFPCLGSHKLWAPRHAWGNCPLDATSWICPAAVARVKRPPPPPFPKIQFGFSKSLLQILSWSRKLNLLRFTRGFPSFEQNGTVSPELAPLPFGHLVDLLEENDSLLYSKHDINDPRLLVNWCRWN